MSFVNNDTDPRAAESFPEGFAELTKVQIQVLSFIPSLRSLLYIEMISNLVLTDSCALFTFVVS